MLLTDILIKTNIMKTLDNLTIKWFGANLTTIAQTLFIGALALLAAISFVCVVIALITDPAAADSASWGYAD